MYKIIGGDQQEYGPVSLDQLRQWIAEGRANAQTLIQREGETDWSPLGTLPELADAFPAAPAPSLAGHPSAEDILQRDYTIDIGACLTRAWHLLKENFGVLFAASAIFLAIQVALSLLGNIPYVGSLVSLGSLVIYGPLTAGVYYVFLRHLRGDKADVGEVFAGFRPGWSQLMLGYLAVTLLTLAAALPGIAIAAVGFYPVIAHGSEPTPVQVALLIIGLVVLLIPVLYLSLAWLFTLPLIIDRGMPFWPAMELSRKVVNKHWWLVFALMIVLGLVNIVGFLACCVGIFFSFPLMIGAMMTAYEEMFGRQSSQSA